MTLELSSHKAAQQAQCSRPVEPGFQSQGPAVSEESSRAADWGR
jgi:hypothetical protein